MENKHIFVIKCDNIYNDKTDTHDINIAIQIKMCYNLEKFVEPSERDYYKIDVLKHWTVYIFREMEFTFDWLSNKINKSAPRISHCDKTDLMDKQNQEKIYNEWAKQAL